MCNWPEYIFLLTGMFKELSTTQVAVYSPIWGLWCDRVEINRPPHMNRPRSSIPAGDVFTAQSNTTYITRWIIVLPTTTDAGCRPFQTEILVNIRFALVKAIVMEKKIIFINILSVSGMIFWYFYSAKIYRFLEFWIKLWKPS